MLLITEIFSLLKHLTTQCAPLFLTSKEKFWINGNYFFFAPREEILMEITLKEN